MYSVMIVFLVLKRHSCRDSKCILPVSNSTGLNYYGPQNPAHQTLARVRCGTRDYVTLGCYNGLFHSYSFGNLVLTNINTFCGGENCFSRAFADLNKTGRIHFHNNCYKHNFGGGFCEMQCHVNLKVVHKDNCINGKLKKTDTLDIELCPPVKITDQKLFLLYATEDKECFGLKCTLKCDEGYESTPGVTKGDIHRHHLEKDYRCYKNSCNFPKISNGDYSAWDCLYRRTIGDNAPCAYVCDKGYVANRAYGPKSNHLSYVPCRKDEIWKDAEKSFCTEALKKITIPNGGGEEDYKTDPTITIPPEKPQNTEKDAAVFATKSMALQLLWLLAFVY